MYLKRKRSESELSFSSSFSSPPRPESSRAMEIDVSRFGLSWTPAHLPSRTMKRFRDNRPSDAEVHQHTMDLLYSARQQPEPQQAQPPSPVQQQFHGPGTTPLSEVAYSQDASQRSLHSFWKSSCASTTQKRPSFPTAATPSCPIDRVMQYDAPMSCEDCGTALSDGEGMDMGDCVRESQNCGACGKAVCFSCSVSNLGEHRRCLLCAGRRGTVGRDSWTGNSHEAVGIF